MPFHGARANDPTVSSPLEASGARGLPSYGIISPVRDEAQHLARTAQSLIGQTHRPLEWVIVDDGSTDGTRSIAEDYARTHSWITVIDSEQPHGRARGAPIVRAFEAGRRALADQPEITVKMDGDLFLPPHYFEWVARVFARDPRAGIVGGVVLIPAGGRWVPDGKDPHNVNGVAKAYRSACLDDIGGLRASMGWDGIDEYGARARGWLIHVLAELTILHYKPRGSKQPWWQARWEEGRGNHFMGYRWDFLLLRALFRMVVERPPVLGGLVLALGFAQASLRGLPRIDDARAREELRSEQAARLRGLVRGRNVLPRSRLPEGGPAFWGTEGL